MACVLIVTALDDAATDEVISRLRNRGIPHKRLNTDAYPFSFPLTFQPDELTCRRQITLDGDWLPQPSSIWYRRVRTPPKPQDMDDEVYTFCVRESRATLTGSILCLRSAWMSHPSAVWQAEHKPLQLATAVQCGLRIPSTVITNDPNVIRVFFDKHRETIVKPAHSGNVTKGGQQFSIFTSQLLEEHLEHVHTASLSPSIYQALIRKRFDVRVTIVGHQIFAAAIDSQSDPSAAVDWRQANSQTLPHYTINLPAEVNGRLMKLMTSLNLTFAAIDMIQTPEGDYIFLEVNPNGEWLWLDDLLHFGISDAVTEWLTNPPRL